jgi:ATP/maltotriose-dependent transcriptional regulator MalT
MMRGDLGAARAHAEEALALSTELGDDRGSTESLRLLGFIATLNGEPRRGLELIDQAVALARADSDASALAHALAARARTHLFQGHGAAGLDDFEASLAVAQRIDLMAVMNARMGIGWAALCVGQYDRAEVQLPLALASARRIGDRHATATALAWMGELRRVRGDDAGARSYLDESVAIATDIATPHPLGRALLSLGRIALANGDTAASEHFERAITIARTSTLPFLLAPCLTALGEIELGGGDRARARQLLDEALARARDCDDRAAEAHALHGLGDVARAEGDDERGAQLHLDALALRAAIGDQPGLADSLEALGGLVADDGRTLVAARLFAAAERLRDKGGFIRPGWRQARYHADVAAAREGSDPGEFDVAWREGAALSVAEAVAYASKGRGRRKRPATGWEALTPAERQVVQLVAQGMTNPETAERLFISTETVKAHLSRAYQKLGVRSRRDLRSAVRPQQ